jgi:hypothetical protein
MEARIAIMAITTRSSISVNPRLTIGERIVVSPFKRMVGGPSGVPVPEETRVIHVILP